MNQVKKLVAKLETVTPLWTGGVETGKMSRVHETGIIGSLRWWYEAIVRGLGGEVCNPTGPASRRCNYEKHGRVCDVCRLFGATGWSRRFRLEIRGGDYLFPPDKAPIRITAPGGGRGWYFGAPVIATEDKPITGCIHQLRGGDVANDLAVVAALINRWGGLGAKTQHGWGVTEIVLTGEQGNSISADVDRFVSRFAGDTQQDRGLPSLGNFFFIRLYLSRDLADDWWRADSVKLGSGAKDSRWRLEEGFSVPIAPAVKYKLRYGRTISTQSGRQLHVSVLRSLRNRQQTDSLFGSLNPNRASMLNISNAYKQHGRWQFRLWGWFPEQGDLHGINRNSLIEELYRLVTANAAFWDSIFGPNVVDLSQTVWREVDRTDHRRNRPTCTVPPISNADLLRCLLT